MYYALIGDIVSSKSLIDRRTVQRKLETIIKTINETYSTYIEKKIGVTLGDEFQGLFNHINPLFEIIHKIEFELYPTKLRFGIGIGSISFDFGEPDSPFQSDGEVWWNARTAIETVKKMHSTNKLMDYSNIYVCSLHDVIDESVNASLDLCYSIKKDWTDKQRNVIHHSIQNYGLSERFVIKEVADEFTQSVSTIFNKYKSSRYLNYVHVLVRINELLKEEV